MTVYSGKFILTETHLTDFKLTNMYMSVSYNISVRAVTTIGGNSDWSEIKTVITTSDSQTPYRITAEPILMTAEPERMKIRWMIPNWQGSPATNLIIERAIVGSCGLAIIDWDTNPHTIENIEILPSKYVNMPLPHYIDVWVGSCIDKSGAAIENCPVQKKLSSATQYVFRAKANNTKGVAGSWSPDPTYFLLSGQSQGDVDVSPVLGNDTKCSKNGKP